jgi:transcriptional regulator with XRE-family HTH domain
MAIQYMSSEDFLGEFGDQIRRLRIKNELDQAQLAAKANISKGAVRNIENGKGSSLKTVIQVIRALGKEQWLQTLYPTVSISPMQALYDAKRNEPRQRVFRKRKVE